MMVDKELQEIIKQQRKEIERYTDNYWMLSHWLEAKIAGIGVDVYFEERQYKSIAIYGMGELANRLLEDLANSGCVQVVCGIDRDVANSSGRIGNIYSLGDELPMVDAVIVTPIYAFASIKKELEQIVSCDIISLEEVVWSL